MERTGQNLPESARLPSGSLKPRRGLLGGALVKEGLIGEDQLGEALAFQRDCAPDTQLGQILVMRGVITPDQLAYVLDRLHKRYRIGELLVETGTLGEEDLQRALEYQRQSGQLLGEALIALHLVTEDQIQRALCTQFGITFIAEMLWDFEKRLAWLEAKVRRTG